MAAGCEETIEITDAAYVERLVVHGIMQPGSPVDITISRTLPINQPYSDASAQLTDVAATITVEDAATGAQLETVSLVHSTKGHYHAPSMSVESGRRYRFSASWRGKSVSASTVVPQIAQVDTLDLFPVIRDYTDFKDTMLYMRAVVRARAGEVYLLTTADVDPRSGEMVIYNTYGEVPAGRMRDATPGGHIVLLERGYRSTTPTIAVVISYDEPYYDFQQTYYSWKENGPFSTGSDNVRWTVEGDGIGLFIGRAVIERRL
ncbi:MAG: hypothetical protein H7X80_02950 [bacterium]|nr:hypothetical protein [Candidatus Kapabacteria bacterium]